MAERIPFTVIGGYLGAGKTTLLNHILRNTDGRRFALLVNDFGSINIDAELIENQDGDTVNLANGCVCCTLAGGFLSAINTLLERDPPPEHIIVEASGVADPHKIAQYGNMPRLLLDGVLVVVDAETIRRIAQDKYVGRTVMRQLHSADLLILNKIDLVTEAEKRALYAWLANISPNSRIIESQYGIVPLQLLLGTGTHHDGSGMPKHEFHDHDHDHDHGTQYETWDYIDPQPISRRAFDDYIAQLPKTAIRGKGFVYLADEPDTRMLFQLVGERWSLKPDQPREHSERGTRLVFIRAATGNIDS